MANNFFDFKRFRVVQQYSAMKVGTDGVILGAWCSFPGQNSDPGCDRYVLDIGCGTGLVSLMIAQRSDAGVRVDAIDIDEGAVTDTRANFENSPWAGRLSCFHIPLQEFTLTAHRKYSSIISNPPFFVNSLLSPDEARSKARHSSVLTYRDLLKGVSFLLLPDGIFSVILPFDVAGRFEREAQDYGLFVSRRLHVIPKPDVNPKRIALEFTNSQIPAENVRLIIETGGRHQYSGQYKELTKDFYLKF